MKNPKAKRGYSESILGAWRQRIRYALISALLGALAACGGGSGGGTPDSAVSSVKLSEASLSSAVKVVDASQMQDLIATTGTDNNQQSTLTVKPESALANLPVGQIVFLPPKDANGQEVFVKVESKSQVNGQTQLAVSVPAPHEVFEKIVFNTASQAGLSTKPERSTFLPPWVKRDQNALVSKMRQVGVLDKLFDTLDNGEEGFTLEFPLPTTAKTEYLGNAKIEKRCKKPLVELTDLEGYETKFKWMKVHCKDPVVIEGKFNHKSPNPKSSFEATKKGDALEFDANKDHFIESFTAVSGEIGVESDADGALSNLFSKFTLEDVFGDLSGYALGKKNGLLQAKFSGLSAEDKKGKIPIMGVVVTFAPVPVIPVTGPTSAAQIKATANASYLVMVYVQLDLNVKGEVSAKLVFDTTKFNSRIDIKNNQTTHTKTITNKFDQPKMGDVRLEFGTKVEINGVVGVPIDADLMIANIRFANFTVGAKAMAKLEGDGNVNLGIVPPGLGADVCGEVDFGAGVFAGARLGLNVELSSSVFKKNTVRGGFEYTLNFPEDERQSQEPFWFYKSGFDGCLSTEPPKPLFVSAKPNYAAMNVGTGVLAAGQVYTMFEVDNLSKGSIEKVRIKYLPRDPFAFISTPPSMDAFANAKSIDNLKWNKETKRILVSATDTNGVLLPQGDYDFLIEMTEVAFPGFTPRTGTVQGQGAIYYPALSADLAAPDLLDKVIFKVSKLWSDVKTVAWSVVGRVQSVVSSVVDGAAIWETTFTTSGSKTVTATFQDSNGKVLGSKDIDVTVASGPVTTTDLNAALFEPFDGTALNPELWNTRGATSCGNHQVTSGKATFFGGAYADTQDKKTFTGTKIVIEAIMGGTQGNRDTHFELVDVATGQTIQVGDTSNDATAAPGLYLTTNPGSGKNDFDQRGIEGTTAKLQAYRLTLQGQSATLERGDGFTGAMSTHTFTLPRSIAGKTFYLRVGTGADDCVYSPGTFDSIKINTSQDYLTLSPINNHYYEIADCGTWTQCRQLALARGGELVTIRSQAEQDWLVQTFGAYKNREYGFWIGLTDEVSEGSWKWAGGEPVTFTSWLPGEPNSLVQSNEDHAHLWWYVRGIGWNDANESVATSAGNVTQAIIEYKVLPKYTTMPVVNNPSAAGQAQ